jgi:hypothetical protein
LNPLQLILLGLVVGAAAGLLIVLGSGFFVPFARARRAGLAGMIGGAVGFFLTALVQGPFYFHAKSLSELAEPFGISALVAAGTAGLCAMMILRTPRT